LNPALRDADLVVQRPDGPAAQLMLLFHGVGATPQDMAPLGQRLAAQFPQAFIVCVAGAHASDLGSGLQWFSVLGITESNRGPRVAEAMPGFRQVIEHWQRQSGVGVAGTCLVGFSQGAIMALESTQIQPTLAGRVVALAGRFAVLPQHAPQDSTIHFIHGKADAVMHYGLTVQAAEHWIAMGADVTADVLPHVGHAVTDEVVDLLIERLTTTIPKRLWDEALKPSPA
jgi:phospholipase/carboxylesterase